MNTKSNSYESRFPHQSGPKTNPIRLQVTVTDVHMEVTIVKAFSLAKSAGRELDLTFGAGSPHGRTLRKPMFQ